MDENNQNNNENLSLKDKFIIAQYIKRREEEIKGNELFLSGAVFALIAVALSYYNQLVFLGNYTAMWMGLAGFVIGILLGQRLVFTLLGSVITYVVMKGQCS